jgi:hypothetical protein
MSWDLFVMDIPRSANTVDEVPPDWVPGPIPSREEIMRAILEVVPAADASDPAWVRVEGPDFSVEASIGNDSPLTQFALHIRGGENSIGFVADVLDRLKLRAFDPGADGGIFDPTTAADSLARWRRYRDQVIGSPPSGSSG